ncbi:MULTISPECIES: hypothetical protein [unclassified Flavobacterium]|uniref:hypothetical protein n=1 Tax=unclassified Flavobacterium TaxID=196869 RepID=UPI001F136574|nr:MULTISPECIES: hypothetical protein [unclassified Flavobacterium]UMY66582.1 hypothetical protein MKO97_04135 [Flavobacterium sp. HJ-32-4]
MIMCRGPLLPGSARSVVVSGFPATDSCSARLFSGRSFSVTKGSAGQPQLQLEPSSKTHVLVCRWERRANRHPDGKAWEEIAVEWQHHDPTQLTKVVYGRFGSASAGYQTLPVTNVTWEVDHRTRHLKVRPPGRRTEIDLVFLLTEPPRVP